MSRTTVTGSVINFYMLWLIAIGLGTMPVRCLIVNTDSRPSIFLSSNLCGVESVQIFVRSDVGFRGR